MMYDDCARHTESSRRDENLNQRRKAFEFTKMEVRSHDKEASYEQPNREEAEAATPSNLKLSRSRSRRDSIDDANTVILKSGSRPPPIEYRECLKNHAASLGVHVKDGCGEFMPGGESLKCAACDCHRNFHRKQVHNNRRKINGHGQSGTVMMAFGGAATESSSEDVINNVMHSAQSKKRFRTKFSTEQKSRMMGLAEKLEWKIQKQDEDEVGQFCSQVGIKREVFKVWMHNNKQAMKKQQHI